MYVSNRIGKVPKFNKSYTVIEHIEEVETHERKPKERF